MIRNTISLCAECLIDIPATVFERDGMAVMEKICPVHGRQESVVERDFNLYSKLINNSHKAIYDGVLIDVTYRCNLRCAWCFQHLNSQDVSIDTIMGEVSQWPDGYPIILSGGEPTLRSDLGDIIRAISVTHPVHVLTNGYNIDWSSPCRWVLSYHAEGKDTFNDAIHAAEGTFESIIFTVSTLDEFSECINECLRLGNIAENYRIHMASPVGADVGKTHERVFVSDMLSALSGYKVKISPDAKVNYCPVTVDGTVIMLISWVDVTTIDKQDLNCPPFYQGDHLVTRLIQRGR